MDTTQASLSTRIKVGIFTLLGLVLIFLLTILVNNRPFWWRPCQLVKISVDDATGLKSKSPVRSLGIDIGYLKSVTLYETHVTLGICITAPVEVLPTTRAYLRGEGFLGDKFVELKPVRYLLAAPNEPSAMPTSKDQGSLMIQKVYHAWNWIMPSAEAAEEPKKTIPATNSRPPNRSGRGEIPVGEESQDVQHLVNRVDDLVQQMTGLTDNLKQAIDPEDLRRTMRQLNRTLENASKTLAPEGGLNQTAQRTLAKLEDAIEQLRDQMTRVNQGQGSVGMLLNDPTYAQEITTAIKNVNVLLNRFGKVQFIPDLGAVYLGGIQGGRGWFNLGIWPKEDRYYLLGVAGDSRGRISKITNTVTVGNGQPITTTNQSIDYTTVVFTAMLGKVFFDKRLDLSAGILFNDGAVSVKYNMGVKDWETRLQLRTDVYIRTAAAVGGVDARLTARFEPFRYAYITGGLEGVTDVIAGKEVIYFVGAGLSFNDEDIKLLFALK